MTISSDSFLSSKLLLPFVVCVVPLYSLIFRLSIGTALISFDQSENFSKWFRIVLSSLALVLHTNALQSFGSSSLVPPTLTSSDWLCWLVLSCGGFSSPLPQSSWRQCWMLFITVLADTSVYAAYRAMEGLKTTEAQFFCLKKTWLCQSQPFPDNFCISGVYV